MKLWKTGGLVNDGQIIVNSKLLLATHRKHRQVVQDQPWSNQFHGPDVCYKIKFVAMYLFIKVKGSRPMTYQHLTVDMVKTIKEMGVSSTRESSRLPKSTASTFLSTEVERSCCEGPQVSAETTRALKWTTTIMLSLAIRRQVSMTREKKLQSNSCPAEKESSLKTHLRV